MKTRAFAIAAGLALVACVYLGIHIYSSRWVMAADEAVHSIDGCACNDDLHQRASGGFRRTYVFPGTMAAAGEQSSPLVSFVHSWMQAASFLVLGPSDFSARLPSVIMPVRLLSAFHLCGLRGGLRPCTASLSGLAAVLLLLAAPKHSSRFPPTG